MVTAQNGKEAMELINDSFDLIILDIMMPIMDGLEACNKIRENYSTPIIFLSAKGSDMDRINGLVTGADDYIVKPFNPMEVVVRVKANIRRYKVFGSKVDSTKKQNNQPDIVLLHDLIIYLKEYKVEKNNEFLKLTKTEFQILNMLVQNRGVVFSINSIHDSIWDDPALYISSNSVAVHIKNLRNKIEDDPKNPKILINVWGVGYKIEK